MNATCMGGSVGLWRSITNCSVGVRLVIDHARHRLVHARKGSCLSLQAKANLTALSIHIPPSTPPPFLPARTNLGDLVAQVVVLQRVDDGDAPADRRLVGELHRRILLEQRGDLGEEGGQQRLVGRDDVLALGDGPENDLIGMACVG